MSESSYFMLYSPALLRHETALVILSPDIEESASSTESPQKRFKLDYAYSIITAPITRVVSITKWLMAAPPAPIPQTAAATTSEEPTTSSEIRAGPTSSEKNAQVSTTSTSTCTQSVQTSPQPLSVSEQRLALRKHVISKSTIRDVIQLEQREKYRQLLQKYTTTPTPLQSALGQLSTTSPLTDTPGKVGGRYVTSTPAPPPRHVVTSMSPPSSDSGTGSGSEASGPVYLNKRMIKETSKKPTWTNPFDSKWLENWHKILTENVTETERKIQETKKSLEETKLIGKQHHDSLNKLVDKSICEEVSEDEAIGDELDSFPPLTQQMMDEVEKALSGGPQLETLVDGFNITLTRKDIQTMKDMTWLNDEVINFYFNLLMDRSKKCAPTIHIFNTFFYPRLLKVGHQGLARWTRRVDLFAVDLIMIPIHLGMHWCLAVIDNRAKSITYYDSLLGDNHQCTNALRDYIASEHLAKKKSPLDIQNWKLVIEKEIPEQLNGCDCGVFTCKYAEYLSQDKAFDFDQGDMPYFRRRMIWEMVNKTLL
ncbi:hypothetical protein ACHWQZ_G006985 [Mnemiopsis leidyi]